ncbi:GNAT family N-acetyltransferase [Conexibacter sp. DBS9H8]|uniref:GNAT family N-acetyltransferase n=1 Tax=Conexibacter sp. DBS9H8 TaxID=2937801 RepID=UPI002112B1A4|nr:GNAT family N-acetyltransferase [Conexibacter sp. DBS9H8]
MTAGRLESERLVLEPLRPEHAEELSPVLNDFALHEFTGGKPVSTDELRVRFERQAVGHSPDGREGWLNWTVRMRPSGQAVGALQATLSVRERQTVAVLAWVIGVSYQRQGFATEAAALVVSWLRSCGVSRMSARIHPGHHASERVAHAIGLRATDVVEDGEVRWESL